MMSNIQIVKAANDAANNAEVSSESMSLTHDSGVVKSDSTMVSAQAPWKPSVYQSMPDNQLSDFLIRLTEGPSITLAGTDSPMTTIVPAIDPWVDYLSNPRIVDKVANYQLIRGTIEVVGVVAVPGNAYGSYVFTALPNAGNDGGEIIAVGEVSPNLHPTNMMQTDVWARVDVANAENFVLHLPFLWPYDWSPLPNGPVNSWKIYVHCLAPLRTAIPGGVTTGSVKLFYRLLPDYQLAIPHVEGYANGILEGKQHGRLHQSDSIHKFAPHLKAKVSQHLGGQTVSGIAGKVASLAEKAEGIPLIGGAASTVATAAKAVHKVASWFGFTREEDETSPMPIVARSVTNVAHLDGNDMSDVASFMQHNAIGISSDLVGTSEEDCMSFNSIFSRWTIIKTFSWQPSADSGDLLGNWWVTPSYCYADSEVELHLTTAGYLGFPFQFWRGDMEYQVIIPCSKLHRGSVQFFWIPVGGVIPATVTNATLNMIYDVSAGGEQEFTVGFARDVPFLVNRTITDYTLIIPAGATNGRIYCRVVNPLTSQNVAANVEIIILARAKPNMEFAVPKTFNISETPLSEDPLSVNLYQMALLEGASGDEDNHTAEAGVLVSPSGSYPGDLMLFGEKIESARALLQKPSPWFSRDQTEPAVDSVYVPIMGIPSRVDLTYFKKCFTYQEWYKVLFTGIACSERYKLFTNYESVFIGAEAVPFDLVLGTVSQTTSPQIIGPLAPMTATVYRGHEVQVPYYRNRKFVLGRMNYDVKLLAGRANALHFIGGSSEDVKIYHSFGPDIRVTNFRQVPLVKTPTAAPTPYAKWIAPS